MSVDDTTMLSGADFKTAVKMLSETDNKYRIYIECGSAEAARRQRIAGVGEVSEDGEYVRETYSDTLASMARDDPSATVEVL